MAIALQKLDGTGLIAIQPTLGSDELYDEVRRGTAGVTLKRMGITVAFRKWFNPKEWDWVMNDLSQSKVDELRVYHTEKIFRLIPTWFIMNDYTVVEWVGEFEPQWIKPGVYKLKGKFREAVVE